MTLIRFLIDTSSSSRTSVALMITVVLIGATSGALNTWIVSIINDALNGTVPRQWTMAAMFLGLCVGFAATRATSQILLTKLAIAIAQTLRIGLCRTIVSARLRTLEKMGNARLLASFTEDTPAVTNALVQLPTICVNAAIVLGCVAYMAWLSWTLLLVVIVMGGLGLGGYWLLQRKAGERFTLAHKHYIGLLKHFRALVDGSKELQLHAARRDEYLRVEITDSTKAVARYRFASGLHFALAENWVAGLGFVVMGLLLLLPWPVTPADRHVLTGFVLAFLYLTPPVQAVLSAYPSLKQASLAAGRLRAFDAELTAAAMPSSAATSVPHASRVASAAIELRGVMHTYVQRDDEGSFTVGPLDLTIAPGEMLFVAGGNGSGKTTMMKLLTGLYIPDQGEIRIGGVRVTPESLDAYRAHFSAVFTDFFVFDRLVGLRDLAPEARTYLTLLRLDHKVKIDGDRLSTTELSQGQRKRLALLTAYLEDRPVYVFDEWAADQDPEFREVFYRSLLPDLKARGKTLIIVTHDDRYYGMADRLVKLETGRIEAITRPKAQVPA
jgi:putative ATP-binding cassette transporter